MTFYVNDVDRQSSNANDGYDVLSDPSYREKYREKFAEAQNKGMDMVFYNDGTIVLIENKISMSPYAWDRKKRDFDRAKLGSNYLKKKRKNSEGRNLADTSREEEFAN